MEKIKRLKKGELQVLSKDNVTQIFIQRCEWNSGYVAGSTLIALPSIILPCRTSCLWFKQKSNAIKHAKTLIAR